MDSTIEERTGSAALNDDEEQHSTADSNDEQQLVQEDVDAEKGQVSNDDGGDIVQTNGNESEATLDEQHETTADADTMNSLNIEEQEESEINQNEGSNAAHEDEDAAEESEEHLSEHGSPKKDEQIAQQPEESDGKNKNGEEHGEDESDKEDEGGPNEGEVDGGTNEKEDEEGINEEDEEETKISPQRRVRHIIIDSDEEENEDAEEEEKNDGPEEGEIDEPEGEKSGKEDEEEENQVNEGENVSELMQNIFGDDMSDDDDEEEKGGEEGGSGQKHVHGSDDEDEPKLVRVEHSEDEDQDLLGRKWDFDVMLAKKKQERRRRRRRDGSIDLMADADDQIKALVDAMTEAANDDRNANTDRRPAVKKRKMLPLVKNTLMKADLFEAMLDNGMISAISEWLAPLPDKSLPALEIRCTILKILERWPNLEQGILKQSGLGRAVMYLLKHPKETKENKMIAAKLIREWSRPIFQLDSDFRSLTKEERVQRDYSQMPLAKRKRLSIDDESGIPIFSAAKSQKNEDEDEEKRPGDRGFIPRARVPKPSTKDYVVRPRPEIEGQFRGETKNKHASRLVRTQREFRQKNQNGIVKRAVGVSISGKNL